MKSKFFIACLVVTTLFISCKEEKVKEEVVLEEKVETFEVILDMVVNNDDNFQVFYTDDLVPQFDDKKSIWTTVKGLETAQKIVFSLPQDDLPTNFRIDLGNNKDQKPMILKSITFKYFDKIKTLTSKEILTYFVVGEKVIFNQETGEIDFTKSESEKEFYDPLLYPQDNLKEEIEKLVK
jgi:hypothetical protein